MTHLHTVGNFKCTSELSWIATANKREEMRVMSDQKRGGIIYPTMSSTDSWWRAPCGRNRMCGRPVLFLLCPNWHPQNIRLWRSSFNRIRNSKKYTSKVLSNFIIWYRKVPWGDSAVNYLRFRMRLLSQKCNPHLCDVYFLKLKSEDSSGIINWFNGKALNWEICSQNWNIPPELKNRTCILSLSNCIGHHIVITKGACVFLILEVNIRLFESIKRFIKRH